MLAVSLLFGWLRSVECKLPLGERRGDLVCGVEVGADVLGSAMAGSSSGVTSQGRSSGRPDRGSGSRRTDSCRRTERAPGRCQVVVTILSASCRHPSDREVALCGAWLKRSRRASRRQLPLVTAPASCSALGMPKVGDAPPTPPSEQHNSSLHVSCAPVGTHSGVQTHSGAVVLAPAFI
jgi:hypothetical protein